MTELASLLATLGTTFEDISHLENALVHRSCLNESEDDLLESNERLEFLGDAVLGFIIAEELYHRFPHSAEGDLTTFRSTLVQTETLARISRTLRLGEYLCLGKGEEETGGRDKQRNLACVLEALIGALFLDQGYAQTRQITLELMAVELNQIHDVRLLKDPKTRLQEITQAQTQSLPSYEIIDTSGPEHERVFTVEVSLAGNLLGRGTGESKRGAEQEAAKMALDDLEGETLA